MMKTSSNTHWAPLKARSADAVMCASLSHAAPSQVRLRALS
jgi:hypothetical protein